MKKLILFLLLILFSQLQGVQAVEMNNQYPVPPGRSKKTKNSLEPYAAFLVPVVYRKDNDHLTGAIHVIPTKDRDNVPSSFWFFLKFNSSNRLLGKDLSAMLQISQMEASPDGRYLAVVSVGEGHPILEVMDVPTLVRQQKVKNLVEINPYPGYLSIGRWRGNNLVIESDMLLTHGGMNERSHVPSSLELDPPEKFNINTATKKISPVKPILKTPVKYYGRKLRHKKLSTRRLAVEALKTLNSSSALPYLKNALKREKDKGLRKHIMRTIKALKG